ncbi:reverse transcriptase domain-containing protein [Tanacetum coccineum]
MDPPGDTTVPITPLKRSSIQDLYWPTIYKDPTTMSPDDIVNVKAKYCNADETLQNSNPSFAKIFNIGALIHHGAFRLQEGTNIYSCRRYTCRNGLKQKRIPHNDARVVCKFLKSLFARFGAPRAIISDRGTHCCNDQFAKVMLKYGVTHRLSTAYHP